MSVLDFAISAIMLISLLVGLFRGFIREVMSLAAWIAALWAAYAFAQTGGAYLEPYIQQSSLRIVAAFAIIFVFALIAASLLGHLLGRVLTVSGIGGVDRSLGLLFGAGRGVVVVAALILTAIFMDIATQPWWHKSVLVNYFNPAADLLRSLMPQDLAVYFQPKEGIG